MNRILQAKRGGVATAMVLLAVVILSMMGMGLLALGQHSRVLAARTSLGVEARNAADAGLVKAIFEMNEMLNVKPWNDGVLPNCNATFSYTVTGDSKSGYIVESVGRSGQYERRVGCSLRLKGPFECAIFAEEGVELKNSAVIDGYNYDEGPGNLKVGTNSTAAGAISLKNSATIKGDVYVGEGGMPVEVIELKDSADITGSTYSLTEYYQMQPITVPGWLAALSSGGEIVNSATISNSGRYDKIDLGDSEAITINGDVSLYIAGDVELGNSAKIWVIPGSSLRLYLGGNYEGKNSSSMNNVMREPKRLKIYGLSGCRSMRFKNGGDFYGAIYAPYADVEFDNSADAFGSVVAKSLVQKNSAAFNYDASLRNAEAQDENVCFAVKRWRE